MDKTNHKVGVVTEDVFVVRVFPLMVGLSEFFGDKTDRVEYSTYLEAYDAGIQRLCEDSTLTEFQIQKLTKVVSRGIIK